MPLQVLGRMVMQFKLSGNSVQQVRATHIKYGTLLKDQH
jgi:hypothetical protein